MRNGTDKLRLAVIMHDKKEASAAQIFLIFLILGLTSFGGPTAHIGYFHQTFIKQKKWLTEAEFSQMLALCQFIPGPASSQLGVAIGFSKGGLLGAFAAFIGFTVPSVIALVAFVSFLPLFSNDLGLVLIHGLKLVAVIVVTDAVISMASKLCFDIKRKCIALLAAIMLLLVSSTYMQVGTILLGALIGLWLFRVETKGEEAALKLAVSANMAKACLLLFLVLLIFALLPYENVTNQVLASLYQAGSLVFGGGHVVLPFLEESVVGQGVITEQTFLAGYGATQAVPGPLFTFASYISAVIPVDLPTWLMVTLGTLAVFLPGFLLLFAVLPAWQSVASNYKAKAALAGVNAAVVGVLAASLYDPIITSSLLGLTDVLITLIGLALLRWWGQPPIGIVAWTLLANLVLAMYR